MGRPKKNVDAESIEEVSTLAKLEAEISKEFGDGVFIGGEYIKDRRKTVISVCPSIDYVLGGGISSGSWVSLTGIPKAGKSSLALHFASKCQKDDRVIFYLDAEGRLKSRDLSGIPGLDLSPDKFRVITSSEENILSAEKFLGIADKIIHTQKKAVVIIDSISVLTEESRLIEFGKQNRGAQAKIVSDFCSRLATVVPIMDSIIVCITHIIANVSGYGAPTIEKSANSLLYQVDTKLRVKKHTPWQLSDSEDPIGQIVSWECLCSSLRGPGRKCESYLRYGAGYDEVAELVHYALEFGVIRKGGAWMYIGEDIKLQGFDKLCDFLKAEENQETFNQIKTEVMEMLL